MKTLVVYHKQLGDTLLLQPALAKLAQQDGEPVGLIARPGFEDLIGLMKDVRPLSWKPTPSAERLLCYDAGDRSAFVSFWCRAKVKHLLTFSDFYQRFFCRWIFDQIHFRDQVQMYRGEYFWASTPGDACAGFVPPQLEQPPQEWLPSEVPKGEFLLIHATSAWQRKCWPSSSWRQVIAKMQKVLGLPVVVTGGNSEWERLLCAEIAQGLPGVINLGGKTHLRGIMAVASKASLVLAVDGFVSHLAAAFRRPCVTLFGPTNVNHWHLSTPWACAVYTGDPGAAKKRTMDSITVEHMLSQTEGWLKEIGYSSLM